MLSHNTDLKMFFSMNFTNYHLNEYNHNINFAFKNVDILLWIVFLKRFQIKLSHKFILEK